jgi:predicted Zn-dependent protease
LAGFAAVAMAVGAWYLMTHWAVKEIVKRTPVSAEVAWGNAMSSMVLAGKKPLKEGPVYNAAHQIWERLVITAKPENPGYPLTLHVVEDPMVNAFAMPGGHVVLMTGLMNKADSPEEVAGVLAHEIQHVLKRHVAARVAQSAGTRLLISSITGRGGLSNITLTAQQLGELSYSREQETEADREGTRLMAMAGLPPGALADILRKMEPKESFRWPSFLATHPQGDARLKNLARNASKWKVEKPYSFDISWPTIKQNLGAAF